MRDRSEGWQHAKRSGHALEDALSARLRTDRFLSAELHRRCFGVSSNQSCEVEGGGLAASRVPSVLGDMTAAKADLLVHWASGRSARISLKKSESGQVWLVDRSRFEAGISAQLGLAMPEAVREGLRLFIGPLDREEVERLQSERRLLGPVRAKDGLPQEIHQRRLVTATLVAHFRSIWLETVRWMARHLPEILDLCFARGLCREPAAQAEFIWYLVTDERTGKPLEDRLFSIASILDAASSLSDDRRIAIGPRNGGSTITLPFGFLQMHRPAGENQMQFHHMLSSLRDLCGA